MKLIEREKPLNHLQTAFQKVKGGEGHTVFIAGEAGIGKTSLVKEFCHKLQKTTKIFQGTCDALFTPRPLAPLHDVLLQLNQPSNNDSTLEDRFSLFTRLFYELNNLDTPCILLFEDIHWADDATIDFIKFLSRRIAQLQCLFVLTYRQMGSRMYPSITNVLGQLYTGSYSHVQVHPLSKAAVEQMAVEKGYKGEDVYAVSGGNPFYVNEILESYSLGVPDNIKNSILSIYNRLDDDNRQIWQILSVLPSAFEVKYLETIDASYGSHIQSCLDLGILIIDNNLISFKHELFRRTVESSLSPFLRIELNKRILQLFKQSFENNGEIERIIHHAKAANDNETVLRYAPIAARQAAMLGAHTQASKLYLTAVEYYEGHDPFILTSLYQPYVYECYLSNQIKEAIIYTGKLVQLFDENGSIEDKSASLCLLSTLWSLEGSIMKAQTVAVQAYDLLNSAPPSAAKAMTLSNMAHVRMLLEDTEEAIVWGEKAIEMAIHSSDEKIHCQALNNVGTSLARTLSGKEKGNSLLQQSLEIALKNGYHEDVARAYTNIGSSALLMKDYSRAKQNLDAAILYVQEKDLNTWTMFLLAQMAKLHLLSGEWDKSEEFAETVLRDEPGDERASKIEALLVLAKIKMRKGGTEALAWLRLAKTVVTGGKEFFGIVPLLNALLEYEWITGEKVIEEELINLAINRVRQKGNIVENSEFCFWLWITKSRSFQLDEPYEGYRLCDPSCAASAAAFWSSIGCPYEQALMLFQGDISSKMLALAIIDKIGAKAIFEKMKFIMRASGFRQLPKGIRRTTRANSANLTIRELDVLNFLKKGLQNKEIGEKLFISPKTVERHISSILFKLDVNSRMKAVHQAIELKLIH